MKTVTYCHIDGCPYCRQADQIIKELIEEHPEYAAIRFDILDEHKDPARADKYDYYANPAMFIGDEKLYESHLFEKKEEARAHIEKVLAKAMED